MAGPSCSTEMGSKGSERAGIRANKPPTDVRRIHPTKSGTAPARPRDRSSDRPVRSENPAREPFVIGGLNEDLGLPTIQGTCTTCHDTPNMQWVCACGLPEELPCVSWAATRLLCLQLACAEPGGCSIIGRSGRVETVRASKLINPIVSHQIS